jgi:hypothetical protein
VILFAYCDRCRTLFTNGAGKRLEHWCRWRTTEGLHEQIIQLEWRGAERIEDLAQRAWTEVKP